MHADLVKPLPVPCDFFFPVERPLADQEDSEYTAVNAQRRLQRSRSWPSSRDAIGLKEIFRFEVSRGKFGWWRRVDTYDFVIGVKGEGFVRLNVHDAGLILSDSGFNASRGPKKTSTLLYQNGRSTSAGKILFRRAVYPGGTS